MVNMATKHHKSYRLFLQTERYVAIEMCYKYIERVFYDLYKATQKPTQISGTDWVGAGHYC